MSDTTKKLSFALAMKTYFQLPGQTGVEFIKEYKALSQEDRMDFYRAFLQSGIEVEEPRSA